MFKRFEIEELFDHYLEACNIDSTNSEHGGYCQWLECTIKSYIKFIEKALKGKFKFRYNDKDCETLVSKARLDLCKILSILKNNSELTVLSLYNRKKSTFHYFKTFNVTKEQIIEIKTNHDEFLRKQKELSSNAMLNFLKQ